MKYYSPVRLKGEFGHVIECLFLKVMGLQLEERSLSLALVSVTVAVLHRVPYC